MKCQPPASSPLAERACSWSLHWDTSERKVLPRVEIVPLWPFLEVRNPGCRVAPVEGGLSMHAHATSPHYQELHRLGDEIAELSAHLDAATARLLDLIREFDARGGWNSGFSSCAAWLSWRVGFDLGAARERVRVARALGSLPRLAQALARGELSYAKTRTAWSWSRGGSSPRWARCSSRPSPPRGRRSTSERAGPDTFPRNRRR